MSIIIVRPDDTVYVERSPGILHQVNTTRRRCSKSAESTQSHRIALYKYAAEHGRWTTGAPYDRDLARQKLAELEGK